MGRGFDGHFLNKKRAEKNYHLGAQFKAAID